MNREEPISVIGYIRVSMAREEMISPEIQRTAITDWATRNNRRIVRWIEDLDKTGRNFKRRIIEGVAAIEAGEAKEIAVWKFSRFGRQRLGWAVNLDRVESVGGALQSATEEVDARTAAGRFQRGILAEVAAFESEIIGENWRAVHANRLAHGLPATGKPRWGYVYDRVNGFTPDLVLGQLLGDLYRRYTAGESAERLVEWLNVQGILTTTEHQFEAKTLLRMLDTGFGAGLLRRHDPHAKCQRRSGTCGQSSHMEFLSGAHQPVITVAEWSAYRAQRMRRAQIPSRTKGSTYPLSGLVQCARCDGPMYPSDYGAERTPKYRCSTRAKRGPSACRGGYVMATFLERAVRAWLSELVRDVDRLAAVAVPNLATKAAQVDARRVAQRIEKLDDALTRLTVDRAMGIVPDVAYVSARDRIAAERAVLAERYGTLELRRQETAPPAGVYVTLARDWDNMRAERRRDMCRSVIKQVTVLTGRPRAEVRVIPRWVG